MQEKHQLVTSRTPPTWDLTRNPGTCGDRAGVPLSHTSQGVVSSFSLLFYWDPLCKPACQALLMDFTGTGLVMLSLVPVVPRQLSHIVQGMRTVCVSVCQDRHARLPPAAGSASKLTFSQFWRLEVQTQGVGRATFP